jgi:recombinational DNA repair protein (RecF pathway)
MGLVFASAQGIRLEKSKLRYSIDDYRLCTLALVRGREVWRITSAKEDTVAPLHGKSLIMFARVASLLKRVLHGEEVNSYLYDSLESVYGFLSVSDLSVSQIKTCEILLVLRCLYALGYINGEGVFSNYIKDSLVDEKIIESFLLIEKEALNKINHAITQSHL